MSKITPYHTFCKFTVDKYLYIEYNHNILKRANRPRGEFMKLVLYLFKIALSLPAVENRIVLANSAAEALEHIGRNADFRKDTQFKISRLDVDTDVEKPTIVHPKRSLSGTYDELKDIITRLDEPLPL